MPPVTFMGIVTKVGAMNKTATVRVARTIVHPKTGKELQRSKKFLTHDEENALRLNDTVIIRHSRPLSARKRFILDKIVKSPEREWEEMHAGNSGSGKGSVAGEGLEVDPSTSSSTIPPNTTASSPSV